jgi:hypothetical protein
MLVCRSTPFPCWRFGLILGPLLLASSVQAQFSFAPRMHEDMEACLTVEVGQQITERGLGEATLTLTIVGPPTLDVEEPRLDDAAAAWKEERSVSTRTVQGQRVVWSQVIRLQQVKRGLEPLPDVTVRFRRSTNADWIEEKWIDILRNIWDWMEPPPAAAERPSWHWRWSFALTLVAIGLLVLAAWLRKQRKGRQEAPLPLDQWALQEIERLEKTLTPPQGEAEAYHTQLSFVVRRYLAERFGLHSLQQTTPEFLEAIRRSSQLSVEKQTLLTELFARCDLAKFARTGTSSEECRRAAELARQFVRQTTSSV